MRNILPEDDVITLHQRVTEARDALENVQWFLDFLQARWGSDDANDSAASPDLEQKLQRAQDACTQAMKHAQAIFTPFGEEKAMLEQARRQVGIFSSLDEEGEQICLSR